MTKERRQTNQESWQNLEIEFFFSSSSKLVLAFYVARVRKLYRVPSFPPGKKIGRPTHSVQAEHFFPSCSYSALSSCRCRCLRFGIIGMLMPLFFLFCFVVIVAGCCLFPVFRCYHLPLCMTSCVVFLGGLRSLDWTGVKRSGLFVFFVCQTDRQDICHFHP